MIQAPPTVSAAPTIIPNSKRIADSKLWQVKLACPHEVIQFGC
jgi:hypothetical protein